MYPSILKSGKSLRINKLLSKYVSLCGIYCNQLTNQEIPSITMKIQRNRLKVISVGIVTNLSRSLQIKNLETYGMTGFELSQMGPVSGISVAMLRFASTMTFWGIISNIAPLINE